MSALEELSEDWASICPMGMPASVQKTSVYEDWAVNQMDWVSEFQGMKKKYYFVIIVIVLLSR